MKMLLALVVLVPLTSGAQMVRPLAPSRAPLPTVPLSPKAPEVGTPGFSPPSTGVPLPGQPGADSGVQRSPNKRILPASPESGVWAADEVRGATRAPYRQPLTGTVKGQELPALDGVPPHENLPLACQERLTYALERMPAAIKRGINDQKTWGGGSQLPCLVARLYKACVEDEFENRGLGRHSTATIPGDRGDWDKRKALAHIARHAKEKCSVGNTEAVEAIVEWVRTEFKREATSP